MCRSNPALVPRDILNLANKSPPKDLGRMTRRNVFWVWVGWVGSKGKQLVKKFLKPKITLRKQGGEFHISDDASRLISVFSPRRKERSKVSREILNDLNFKMQPI